MNQVAVNFLNDSFRTSLCLQYTPNEICMGGLFLAALHLSIEPMNPNAASITSKPEKLTWYEILAADLTEEALKGKLVYLFDG